MIESQERGDEANGTGLRINGKRFCHQPVFYRRAEAGARQTILDPVPMADRRFTKLPTKAHHSAPGRREVDEALFTFCRYQPWLWICFDPIFDFLRAEQNFVVYLNRSIKSVAAGSSCSWEMTVSLLFFSRLIFSRIPSINGRTVGSKAFGFIHRKQPRKSASRFHTKSFYGDVKDPSRSAARATARYCPGPVI